MHYGKKCMFIFEGNEHLLQHYSKSATRLTYQ